MINNNVLQAFIAPYYADKDIMHNLWHVELVLKSVRNIIALGNYVVDEECLTLAASFHGFVYRDEEKIRQWLQTQGYTTEQIAKIIRTAWESQRPEIPETLEGKILHDAHVLEGGRTYLVVKTLITGSLRGQSLPDTLTFMKEYVLDKNTCYLPETIPLCEEMNQFANRFFYDLLTGIQMKLK